MALYMDVHANPPEGATAQQVAGAHDAETAFRDRCKVAYRSYWADAATGRTFCRVDAPSAGATAVHRQGHGLVADQICEVGDG